MDNKIKLNLTVPPGEAVPAIRLGNDFHVLEDKTSSKFVTNRMGMFCGYLKAKADASNPVTVYVNNTECEAYQGETDRYSEPIAKCSLEASRQLKAVLSKIGSRMSQSDLDEFLSSFKGCCDTNGHDLLDKARDLKVCRVVSIERNKQPNGTFKYAVKSESGKGDMKLPEQITFTVPLFAHHDVSVSLAVDVFFDFAQDDDACACFFSFINYDRDDVLEAAREDFVRGQLETAFPPDTNAAKLYWGDFKIEEADDHWKYRENAL